MKRKAKLALSASLALVMITICFGFGSSELSDQTKQELDPIIAQLDSIPNCTIYLNGYSDNVGSKDDNKQLSAERAISVKNYLISKKVDSTKISVRFYGERNPVAPNNSEENRALNRRVEVFVYLPETVPLNAYMVDSLQKKTEVIAPVKKKKKSWPRLVWTGWRTGFHWSNSGR